MSNSQMLDDLRYAADNFETHQDEVQSNLREFAASLIGAGISPPAQKPAPVSGDSGAGLVGNPFCSPVKNSGVVPGGSAAVLESMPLTSTTQSFESWVEQLGNLYRFEAAGLHRSYCSPQVQNMLAARELLDEYRAFAAVCQS